jgi:hypothetical protein
METTCRNCAQQTELVRHPYGPDLRACPLCRAFQFVGPLGDLAELYTEHYYTGGEYVNYELAASVYLRNFSRKLELLKTHTQHLSFGEMRVLELGSALGNFMQVLRDAGVEHILGVETSEYSRRRVIERGFQALDPFSSDYAENVRKFAPNVVCAWDVWEHLEKPAEVFRALIEQNPSVQVVALSTVDSGALIPRLRGKAWRQFHPPTHLNYPTRASFQAFFPGVNFKDVSITSFGYHRPLADYLAEFLPVRWVTSIPWLFRIPLYVNLHDIQLVVATRPPSNNDR